MSRKKAQGKHVGTRWLDGRLYQVYRLEPDDLAKAVERRTHPAQNSFDQSYVVGRLPMWVRNTGHTIADDDERMYKPGYVGTSSLRAYDEPRPLGYNRPRAEEPYLEALEEFFETRIALMSPKPRQNLQAVKDWLKSVMQDRRGVREIAENMGFADHTGVVKARQRAVEQLVESCGGKAALAEKLRQYLHAREEADGQDRLKYLPRWIHG